MEKVVVAIIFVALYFGYFTYMIYWHKKRYTKYQNDLSAIKKIKNQVKQELQNKEQNDADSK